MAADADNGAASGSTTSGQSMHDELLSVLHLDVSRLETAGPKSDIYLIGYLDTAETALRKASTVSLEAGCCLVINTCFSIW